MNKISIKGSPKEDKKEFKTDLSVVLGSDSMIKEVECFDEISGFIKRFDPIKGYGFIQPDDEKNLGKGDILIHFSSRSLMASQALFIRLAITCPISDSRQLMTMLSSRRVSIFSIFNRRSFSAERLIISKIIMFKQAG